MRWNEMNDYNNTNNEKVAFARKSNRRKRKRQLLKYTCLCIQKCLTHTNITCDEYWVSAQWLSPLSSAWAWLNLSSSLKFLNILFVREYWVWVANFSHWERKSECMNAWTNVRLIPNHLNVNVTQINSKPTNTSLAVFE